MIGFSLLMIHDKHLRNIIKRDRKSIVLLDNISYAPH